jgi:hypothetical protein
VLELIYKLVLSVSVPILLFVGLTVLALRTGGTIEKVQISGIFQVKLANPLTIPRYPRALYFALVLSGHQVASWIRTAAVVLV